MTHPISAANPHALFAYASTAGRLDDALLAEVHPLGQALHQFAATCTEYSTGVDTGIATRLHSYAQRAVANDDWVGRVGQAFLAADQSAMSWGVDLGGRAVQAITQPVTEAAHWLVQQDAHSAWQTMRSTLPNAGALLDTITGTARSFQQQAGQWVARTVAVSQQHWQRFWTFASPLLQQLFVHLQAGLRRALSMAATAAEYIAKQAGNLVWGMIWGETAFSDVWGGEVVAILGDIIAGVFVVGDIRDIIKYWFVRPFTSDWPWWANALMGGIAIIGIIPLIGDGLKAIVKQGLKQLFKATLKEVVEEVSERVTRETAEHLIRELGENGAKQLVERLGRDLTNEEIQSLLKNPGLDVILRVDDDIPPRELYDFVQKLGIDFNTLEQSANARTDFILQPRGYKVDPKEITFGEKIAATEGQIVLTGTKPGGIDTPGIDGFINGSLQKIQLKTITSTNSSTVIKRVNEALEKGQKAGYKDIDLYLETPDLTIDQVVRRWNLSNGQPRLHDLSDGTLKRIIVYASDGRIELPLP